MHYPTGFRRCVRLLGRSVGGAVALLAALSLGNACSDSSDAGPGTLVPPDGGARGDASSQAAQQTIGAGGGVIAAAGVKLTVPPGALDRDVALAITPSPGTVVNDFVSRSNVFRFEPSGLTFRTPATVEFTVTGSTSNVKVFWSASGDRFEPVSSTEGAGVVSASISHFSFGVAGEPTSDAGVADGGAADDAGHGDDASASSDASSSDAGAAPAPGTLQTGDVCGQDIDCAGGSCANSHCTLTSAPSAPTCSPAGTACSGTTCDISCCTRVCSNHRCAKADGCAPLGELCRSDADCCNVGGATAPVCSKGDPTQTFGRCATAGACLPAGSVCKGASSCGGATSTCCDPSDATTAAYCSSHACCSPDRAGIDRCLLRTTCQSVGAACASSADCCTGNACVAGKCVTP